MNTSWQGRSRVGLSGCAPRQYRLGVVDAVDLALIAEHGLAAGRDETAPTVRMSFSLATRVRSTASSAALRPTTGLRPAPRPIESNCTRSPARLRLERLRVKAIFFAMITLAVATAFQTLASHLSEFTGGEDGLNFKNPTWLSPSFEPFETEVLGLLIMVIGGMGTLYGAVIGSVLFVLAVVSSRAGSAIASASTPHPPMTVRSGRKTRPGSGYAARGRSSVRSGRLRARKSPGARPCCTTDASRDMSGQALRRLVWPRMDGRDLGSGDGCRAYPGPVGLAEGV